MYGATRPPLLFPGVRRVALVFLGLALALLSAPLWAHGVNENDKAFIEGASGINIIPYMYLGAKHMVTGYDHLLFLAGVIFFLYRMKDVAAYVTLFAIGHSSTLLLGVLLDIRANPFLIDAIIGLSVVYKAVDNLNGFRTWFGIAPNPRAAVLIFGFFHGFGLATKLQELTLARDGMIYNLISFNVGVEMGQFMALAIILLLMNLWRLSPGFNRSAIIANAALMTAGFVLIGYQLAGYFTQGA
ncbi:HupE/UreJ family protein [Sphingobium sp. HBC34]|uniref:HupE/UreJ family protein n=1 Tax=Sphingobium cyanobacteriorum TaxID=3063954 RepID=A0ABT8ZQG2_9SPHN|nr:HupE/UreJ family protein [Sphingobium sp. HBC34]MDO7836790.1 HupE/UreJ family protein [Sphingobium sp. HBC34]